MVRVQGVPDVVDLDDDILFLRFGGGKLPVFGGGAGRGESSGVHVLPLAAHVPLMGLFRLREILVGILYVHEGRGQVISPVDGFKPSCLGGKTRRGVEIGSK